MGASTRRPTCALAFCIYSSSPFASQYPGSSPHCVTWMLPSPSFWKSPANPAVVQAQKTWVPSVRRVMISVCPSHPAKVDERRLTRIRGADRFVAYDPEKKTCTEADRSLIKRLAGKQGSETKKRRLRQEKVSRTSSLPHADARKDESGVSSASETESHHPSQLSFSSGRSDTPATRSSTADQDLHFSQNKNDKTWAQLGPPDQQGSISHALTAVWTPWDDPGQALATSVSHKTHGTPEHSETFANDFHDCFSSRSEFKEPNFIYHGSQNNPHQPQHHVARPFGSFGSGFQESDPFDFDFTALNEQCDSMSDIYNIEHSQHVPSNSSALHSRGGLWQGRNPVRTVKCNPEAFRRDNPDPIERHALSVSSEQSHSDPALGQFSLNTPPWQPSPPIERPPSQQLSPRTPKQSLWPNVSSVLVGSMQSR